MKSEGKCCKFEGAYSPQNFLEAVTGKYFILDETEISSLIAKMEEILEEELPDTSLWNYKLSEIEHIVENGMNVVLVELTGALRPEDDQFVTIYRWFEVPEDFTPEEINYDESAGISLKAPDSFSEN